MGKGKQVEANVTTIDKELVGGSSSKTRVGPSQMKKKRKGKNPKNSKGKKVVKGKCYHCNEDGHWSRNCPNNLVEKKAKKKAQGKYDLIAVETKLVLEKLVKTRSSSKFGIKEVVSIETVRDLKLFR
ncbi:gag/pol protein [Cucumis melo var. makuwa]|uniref:Gag/pol protein n=1 Tax=Cucumis melo var. makuwa TaxID=1194695 RepID=A0A5D3CA75_CUCMM|nr:gag/pol protein [Cucumis melo var. makuwa]